MRKLLFLLPVFSHVFAFGQIDVVVLSNTDSSANVFYVHWDNFIQITGIRDFTGYKVTLKGDAELIPTGEPGRYWVSPFKPGACQIEITKNGKQAFTKNYKTDAIAFYPKATAGGTRDSILSKGRLLSNPFLSVVVPGNYYYRFSLVVTSFEAIFLMNGDSVVTRSVGNRFTDEQIKLIKQLSIGDQICFSDIRATGPSYFCNKKLTSFSIQLK